MKAEAGRLLSEYRRRSRLSQLDLANLAEVSPRHISFIENGRTQPSRTMLMRLTTALDVDLQDSNLLLQAAGFAPAYSRCDLNSPDMAPVRTALALMLEKQEPYPAVVFDGHWNILMANQAQLRMTAALLHTSEVPPGTNLLHLVFSHEALRPHIVNWDEVAGYLLRRLRRQVLSYSRPQHRQLLQELLHMQPPQGWQTPSHAHDKPMLTVDVRMGDQVLRLFSTLSQFGTALDIGMEELLIESYFPADDATRDFFMSAATRSGSW
ncbi:MAG: helix-turn-helix transcriptional regulator [Pseudohongiellaceae bacterium]